jgi:hypothetical protein
VLGLPKTCSGKLMEVSQGKIGSVPYNRDLADFNGDANPDIIWKNQATGEVTVWYMSGTDILSEQKIEDLPGPTWEVIIETV